MTTIQKLHLLEQMRKDNERRLHEAGLTGKGAA